jgi:hypothetical protein
MPLAHLTAIILQYGRYTGWNYTAEKLPYQMGIAAWLILVYIILRVWWKLHKDKNHTKESVPHRHNKQKEVSS